MAKRAELTKETQVSCSTPGYDKEEKDKEKDKSPGTLCGD
jgi:hypothetical protein